MLQAPVFSCIFHSPGVSVVCHGTIITDPPIAFNKLLKPNQSINTINLTEQQILLNQVWMFS